jgi:murein DD-endopeptidase MepM/ murein hydrolase activator NlpD
MKSYKKISTGAVVALGLVAIPSMVAHADEGVVTNNFEAKDKNGNEIKDFKENEIIQLKSENESNYQISFNGQVFQTEKGNILKTIKHEEESLSVLKENTTLKTFPDIFGNTLLQLNKEEVIHRVDEVAEQNGFTKVRTSQGLEGWALTSSLKQNLRSIPVNTSAFIDEDTQKDKSLKYGDAVTVVGFESNQYKVSLGDSSVLVGKSAISFTEPPKKFQSPVHQSNPRITSLPGWRTDPVYGGRRHHGGVDLGIPVNTPIYATADGIVIQTHTGETYNNGAGYGNYVKLSHKDDITSIYAHLNSLVVKNGEHVKQGQLVGYSGSTGKSTGPHLHFQMEQNGVLLDTSDIVKGALNELEPAPK